MISQPKKCQSSSDRKIQKFENLIHLRNTLSQNTNLGADENNFDAHKLHNFFFIIKNGHLTKDINITGTNS